MRSLDDFFQGDVESRSRQLFDRVAASVESLGDSTVQISKSQIAFRRRKNFAVVWIPGQYLKRRAVAPLVLTLSFESPDPSPRWKEITEVGPARYTHHLELYTEEEVDDEVRNWLERAWAQAV